MRSRNFKNYCLSAASLGVIAGALVINPFAIRSAQAKVSAPLNNWQVTSVESAGKAYSNYCVAANAFDNKTIMIIAYENGQKSSIAFNLQEKKFKAKEKYPVTLSFSNGAEAQFTALAENESTVIVQAGTDIVLWENLVQNQALTLSTLDVKREYSLQQFDFVYTSLNECVGESARAEDLKNKKVSSVKVPPQKADSYTADKYTMEMPKGLGEVKQASPVIAPVSKGNTTSPKIETVEAKDPAVKYIRSLLAKSSVVVKTADNSPIAEDDYLRYSWITEQDLKGKFEQVYWPADKSFHDLTQSYFERNGMSCSSDFLPMTNEPYRVGDMAIADGQAFCMNTSDSVAVAYVFFGIGNTFTAIEHKGRFDQLETALNVRENIRQTLEYIATGERPVSHTSLPTAQGTKQSRLVKPELPSELSAQQ